MDDEHTSLESDPKNIKFATSANKFMREARKYAELHSFDKVMPNASLLVRDGKVIGMGANGSDYHAKHGCERVRLKIPTGQQYELCEGCHPKNHGEQRAISDAQKKGESTVGADLYLWGHWWFCRWCATAMVSAGIRYVYFLKNSHMLFNKNSKNNIIGIQFNKH